MAKSTESKLSLQKGSDLINDYCCNVCEENGTINKEAQFFCEQCSKCYCDKCVGLHNQLFNKHSLTGRKELQKWKVNIKTKVDAVEKCPEHKNEIVRTFCENHHQLLCHDCLLAKHRQCSNVVTIFDKVKGLHEKGDFQKAAITIDTLQGKLSRRINVLEGDMQSLQETHKKILDDIRTLHRMLSEALKQLETDTIKELDALMAAIKTLIESDTDQCTKLHTKMHCFQDKIKSLEDQFGAMSYIMYTKSLELASKIDTLLTDVKTHDKVKMTYTPDTTIQQTLSTLSGLGKIERISKVVHPTRKEDANKILTVNRSTSYSVIIKTGTPWSYISGICETAEGKLIISDKWNMNMKLLDQSYKVVFQCDLPGLVYSMCSIDPSQVAVAVDDHSLHEIHFIREINGQLIKDRKLKFQHKCRGIDYHHGSLYITTGEALYQYTIDGKQLMKMYEDISSHISVSSCAVSRDGARIYVTDKMNNQLITLSRDGTVISTLTDLEFNWEYVQHGLHVTEMGQVLLCGGLSNSIVQVDRDGKQKLAEVVEWKMSAERPTSVYYSRNTESLIVGMYCNDSIYVFPK